MTDPTEEDTVPGVTPPIGPITSEVERAVTEPAERRVLRELVRALSQKHRPERIASHVFSPELLSAFQEAKALLKSLEVDQEDTKSIELSSAPPNVAILRTRAGAHVVDVAFPPFREQPEVVLWGLRTFKFSESTSEGVVYKECFNYVIPPMR